MAVKVREWKGAWWVFVDHKGRRKAKRVGTGRPGKRAAETAAERIQARLTLGDWSLLDAEPPVAVSAVTHPTLEDAVPTWIKRKAQAGDIRGATPKAYASRLRTWVYPFELQDGRRLGAVPVDQVTREMLGAVILRVKEAGRSLAIIEAIRNPLRGYFAEMIEMKTLPGPNPAADLKFFVGRRGKKRRPSLAFFHPEEGPQLVATAEAAYPRWAPFVLTGLLAGLRWGESAALLKTDIDWQRGRVHVQRTFSEKGNSIEPCKDGEDRWVAASPALLTVLRAHIEAMELEGQVRGWAPDQRALVFPTSAGRIMRHGHFLESVWQPLLAKAGTPYRKYHATRHTYATWMLETGADLRWVQEQMGHASVQQTADTYGHLLPERHRAASGALDQFLGRPARGLDAPDCATIRNPRATGTPQEG
jgi:integrase